MGSSGIRTSIGTARTRVPYEGSSGIAWRRGISAAGARGTDNMVKRKLGLWRMPMEPQGEEGRDKLRKAAGRSTCPLIRG